MSAGEVASVSQLKEAIEAQHGGRASFVEQAMVDERSGNRPVWQGLVHVFDLEAHPTATRA